MLGGAALASLARPRPPGVFCSLTGEHRDDCKMRRAFYRALGAAGLGRLREGARPFRFHDLRHTFGTLAVQTWPLHDVRAYMGHADIATTMIYAHHIPRVSAAAELTRLVDAQSANTLLTDPAAPTGTEPDSLNGNGAHNGHESDSDALDGTTVGICKSVGTA